jgi:hypothetical protein
VPAAIAAPAHGPVPSAAAATVVSTETAVLMARLAYEKALQDAAAASGAQHQVSHAPIVLPEEACAPYGSPLTRLSRCASGWSFASPLYAGKLEEVPIDDRVEIYEYSPMVTPACPPAPRVAAPVRGGSSGVSEQTGGGARGVATGALTGGGPREGPAPRTLMDLRARGTSASSHLWGELVFASCMAVSRTPEHTRLAQRASVTPAFSRTMFTSPTIHSSVRLMCSGLVDKTHTHVFVPINTGHNHWVAMAFDGERRTATYFDSLDQCTVEEAGYPDALRALLPGYTWLNVNAPVCKRTVPRAAYGWHGQPISGVGCTKRWIKAT